VLDAATGKLISAEKFVPVDWAERIDLATGRPVEAPGARYEGGSVSRQMTGALGGHNWHPMAFSPKTGLVYIPAQHGRGFYADPTDFKYVPGAWNTGMLRTPAGPAAVGQPDLRGPRIPARGELIAWDPVRQTKRWSVAFPHMTTSGVLATDGGLVFHSATERFTAYDAATGAPVWSYPLGARAIAPAMTYALEGEQYVALMVGPGGAGSRDVVRRSGRLLVFKLGGTVTPPPYPAPADLPKLDLTTATPSRGDADRGADVFDAYCGACHGGGLYFPNLAHSPAILEPEGFQAIVLDGALKDRGMAGFRRWLDATQVEDVRAFLLWQARNPPPAAPEEPRHAQ
jgi:quinohemoprotein ethanol dehydrogenase